MLSKAEHNVRNIFVTKMKCQIRHWSIFLHCLEWFG